MVVRSSPRAAFFALLAAAATTNVAYDPAGLNLPAG
jgi:hypothetical protein